MSVLPAPRSIESRGPRVPVPPTLPGDLARSLEPWAPRAAALLRRAVPDLGLAATSAGPRATITTALDTTLPAEHYRLDLQPTWWAVQAGDEAGAYWAVQTLLQLLDADGTFVPAIVADGPAYPVRGFMIDLVRHFFGVPELKHLIDLVSTYKANRLHLHLTDDQGWRLEMTSRPALTQRAAATAVGGDAGGFLTIADYENLQRYATERHLEIVPEIDLPGHSHAAMLACPELSPDGAPREPYTGIEVGFSHVHLTASATWDFVEDTVGELARRTHGRFLHLGGDEAHRLERAEYLTFIERLGAVVARHGKRLVLWQEAAGAALPAGTQLQYWTSQVPGEHLARAARAGDLEIIASPGHHAYLDQKYAPGYPLGLEWARPIELHDAYAWDPVEVLPGVPAAAVAGVEACLWTETLRTVDEVTTMVLPRLPAIAEVAWGSVPDWPRFRAAVAEHGRRWTRAGLAFHRSPQVHW